MFRNLFLVSISFVCGSAFVAALWYYFEMLPTVSPAVPEASQIVDVFPDPSQLSFPALQARQGIPSQLEIVHVESADAQEIIQSFSFTTDGKKVSGQIHLPTSEIPPDGYPVILMLRGFVDPAIYRTGIGTRPAASAFAKAGFATIAPDFLGFGDSDTAHPNSLHARFQKLQTVLDLRASLDSYDMFNANKVGLWGHSNGGQIAISYVQVSGEALPTSLWAPVSKGFPYSVLYFTDEYDDEGKALRAVIAAFEREYEAKEFSISNYWSWMPNTAIQIHQGGVDDAVPLEWSQELHRQLSQTLADVQLYTYSQSDHNLRPDWSTVVARDISFFTEQLVTKH